LRFLCNQLIGQQREAPPFLSCPPDRAVSHRVVLACSFCLGGRTQRDGLATLTPLSVLKHYWLTAFVTKPTYWPSIIRVTPINEWLGARPRLRGRKDFETTLSSSLQAQIAERFTEGAGAYPNSEGISRRRFSDYPDDHCWPSGLAEITPPISTDMAAFILRRFDY
jgi:hypothetical protein